MTDNYYILTFKNQINGHKIEGLSVVDEKVNREYIHTLSLLEKKGTLVTFKVLGTELVLSSEEIKKSIKFFCVSKEEAIDLLHALDLTASVTNFGFIITLEMLEDALLNG